MPEHKTLFGTNLCRWDQVKTQIFQCALSPSDLVFSLEESQEETSGGKMKRCREGISGEIEYPQTKER